MHKKITTITLQFFLLSAVFPNHLLSHSTPLFWSVQEKESSDTICYLADLRLQVRDKQQIITDYCALIENMPLFLEQVTPNNLPVIIITPLKLEEVGPLDEQSPVTEGARTGLAWARAYYQLLEGNYDLHVVTVPEDEQPSYEQLITYALRTSRRTRSISEESLEIRVKQCVQNFTLMAATRTYSNYCLTPFSVHKKSEQSRVIPVPESFSRCTGNCYVVAGGGGFIGRHVVKRLLDENNAVLVLDNFLCSDPANIEEFAANPYFQVVRHDITHPCTIEGHVDAIINLASVPSPDYYYRLPYETLQTGLMGTKNMIELARAKKARYVFSSTSEVYGDPLVHPQVESYPGRVDYLGKRSQYDQSKRGAETLLKLYFDLYRLDIRIARIFNTYGPYMMLHDGRVITNFIAAALENKPLKIYGDGTQTRSFGYVDDTVDGLVRLLHNEQLNHEPSILNRVFNIGTPYEFTINELAQKMESLCHNHLAKPIEIMHIPKVDATDPCKRLPNISRAHAVLGFDPHIELDEGLEKTLTYFMAKTKPQAES